MSEHNKLDKIQKKIGYYFSNQDLLRQALTTPQYGNEHGLKNYEILETIGDSVIRLIFILKKYKDGFRSPGKITQLKQELENDNMLKKIARQYFELHDCVFKSENQDLKRTKILADTFEALCGAVFLDAQEDFHIVQEKIIDQFYDDWNDLVKDSSIFNKSRLLEFLQTKLRFTPIIKTEFHSLGPDNERIWIAKNPRIYSQKNELLKDLTSYINHLESKRSKSKKYAEQNLYHRIYKKIKNKI
jgi:ribonuclease-3